MCSNVARLNDIAVGVCYCHPPLPTIPYVGNIIQGSQTIITNNLPTARLTDSVMGCHRGYISTSSQTVIGENLGIARIGDKVSGPLDATIITGSPDTFAGD